MSNLEGSLTPMQHEIMEIVWGEGPDGIATSVIWQRIKERRSVARTTILNQVDRLEKRGWLVRRKTEGSYRYSASIGRDETDQLLADQIVDHFFSGSASRLVASLFGRGRISDDDTAAIRQLLDQLPSSDEHHAGEDQ